MGEIGEGGLVQLLNWNQTLRNFKIYGSALFNELPSTYNPWAQTGVIMHYIQDDRFINNTAVAPGIPYTRVKDSELTTISGTQKYMHMLQNASWSNNIL